METRSKFTRRYDAEFKQNAVALVQSGRSISEVCRDLGCSHWSLGRWVGGAIRRSALSRPRLLMRLPC